MKQLTALYILLFFYVMQLKAQDTIILRDGSEIKAKVLEVGEGTLSYKKGDHLDGPTYTINLSRVFMAIYKNGKQETFKAEESLINQGTEQIPKVINTLALSEGSFEVRLIKFATVPDKKQESIQVSAEIQTYLNGKPFTILWLFASQRKDLPPDFSNPKESFLSKSRISFLIESEQVKKILFGRYEKETGFGYGWALPPKFFLLIPSSCCIALLEQKDFNTELLSGLGGISSKIFNLKDCSSLENKFLSVALLWLNINFPRQ